MYSYMQMYFIDYITHTLGIVESLIQWFDIRIHELVKNVNDLNSKSEPSCSNFYWVKKTDHLFC